MLARHRLLRRLLLAAVVVGLMLVVRDIGATRAPRRRVDRGPIIGSLDTWPPVPRAAHADRPAA